VSARFEVIPSIDLRRGRVVRLREGRDEETRVYATPAELLLERFAAAGARRVHVVDLDAAFGEPPQHERLAELLRTAGRQDQALRSPFRLQLGGGLRDEAAVERALEAGFDRVVLGSMIVCDPAAFEKVSRKHPGRIVPALDCRADEVLHHGWQESSSLQWQSLALSFEQKGLVFPSILVTDVARDGTLAGANVELAAAVGEAAGAPAIVSGGVASIEDVARAAAAAHAGRGVGGIVLGRALHEGRLTIEAALASASFELAGSVAR
jgi:phosphoribosylformimino-5-aminoimidazole carboxamide ribotide isomerase